MTATLAPSTTVRLRPAPAYDPPYDDERHAQTWATAAQPLLELPSPPPARPPAVPAPPQPARRGAGVSPPTNAAAVRFVNTCLEIMNGYRPVTHFRALSCPLEASAVLTAMTRAMRRLTRAGRGDGLVKLRKLRICEPRTGVAEISAVIARGDQAWGLAYRLEQRDGHWHCTVARML